VNSGAKTADPFRWRQFGWITVGAFAVYVTARLMPTGTNIPHVDYAPAGESSIQFCDPGNPQFMPATAVQSPVAMMLATSRPAAAGREVQVRLTLTTYGKKPIGGRDIALSHGKKIHLLIADPTLTDYQHVHPEPADAPGSWDFTFTPRVGGAYRLFADFVPAATGVGLYAWSDMPVAGNPAAPVPAAAHNWTSDRQGFRFKLTPGSEPIRAGKIVDLRLDMERIGGGPVPLEVIMQAYAHLVAFDDQRSGYAHLHPLETDITKHPDLEHPVLTFKLRLPQPGRYVIWSEVQIAGRQILAPFWFDVRE
jgi:hypothetical protein